jgi:predicted amidohydrolase YtcJ
MRILKSLKLAVTGLVVGVGLVACSGQEKADVIILHGKVYAADGQTGFKQAVAIRGNKIVLVGTDAEVEKLRGGKTQVIDAQGKTVLPGLIDNHVHFLGGAGALEGPDLTQVNDVASMQAALRTFLAANPNVEWIRGGGFYADIKRQDLDAVTGDKPAVLMAGDGHSVVANTKALEIAGITKTTPSPAGGEIVKDASGELTGVFLETAQSVMEKALPNWTATDMERLVVRGTAEAHKAGVTTILNVAHPPELEVYDKLNKAGNLKLRIYNALWLTPPMNDARPGIGFPSVFTFSEADADEFDKLRERYKGDDKLKLNTVKIMLDGVIESHTAWMLRAYDNRNTTGVPNYTSEELTKAIALMDKRGWQVMTHGLGDRAVRVALDAYDNANKVNAAPAQGRRHKIEHIETMDPAEVPRFGQLGVTASLQPEHGAGMNDPQMRGERWRNLGFTRSAWGFPWKSIKDAGGRVAFGSDWPVVTINPGRAIQIATNRIPHPPIPDQKLTLAQALDAYTRDSAYAIFADKSVGSLEAGKLADVVILADDIFANPPKGDLVVEKTIFDGKVVYSRTK